MTATTSETIRFLVQLRKIDKADLKVRDTLVLWAIAREPGMAGLELATKLGYASRSIVQIPIRRLIEHGFIEDRRRVKNALTPNDLYILPAGQAFLADILES